MVEPRADHRLELGLIMSPCWLNSFMKEVAHAGRLNKKGLRLRDTSMETARTAGREDTIGKKHGEKRAFRESCRKREYGHLGDSWGVIPRCHGKEKLFLCCYC